VSEFLERAAGEIRRHRLFSRGQKILVAVSGGADSMVLLHALHALAPEHRWRLAVAHFNHRLRGRASNADEQLVRQTAETLRLPFFVEAAEVRTFAAQSKISIEMAARKLRHEFFARIARREKFSTLALAHHADDQVELFFLRLLRGAGGAGLAGMRRRSPSPADRQIALVRPLLGFFKAEIMEFAREKRILFREDASNRSNEYLRNRIRNELLPLLKKDYQPGVAGNVLRVMDLIGAESDLAGEAARFWLEKNAAANRGRAGTEKSPAPGLDFAGLPTAVQRKILQRQLVELGVATDFELVEQLRESPGKPVSVGPDFFVTRDAAGKLTLGRSSPTEFNLDELELKLSGRAGRVKFGGREFRWRLQPRSPQKPPLSLPKGGGVERFDADRVGGRIILRHWRAGDRFQPIGLASAVKLQDLFVNAKIPASRRRSLVVAATAADEIFWVEGLRIGERFKLTPETRRELVWNQTYKG
jgi:tRNA(Ile)-lysidine synthase